MTTYFIMEKSTREGMLSVTESPKRTEGLDENAARFGVQVLEWFYLSGQYDFILKVDAPNEESIEAFVMATSRGGNVRAEFSRAYDPAAWKAIVGRIGGGGA